MVGWILNSCSAARRVYSVMLPAKITISGEQSNNNQTPESLNSGGVSVALFSPLTRQNKLVPALARAIIAARLLIKRVGQTQLAIEGRLLACNSISLPTKPEKGGIPARLKADTKKAVPSKTGCCTRLAETKRSPGLPLCSPITSANKNSAAAIKVE